MTDGRRPGEDWICEEQEPGVWFCLSVRRWLVRRRTPYQRLDLAETETHGRILALDGKFMLSERDEFFYHEMLVHPALLSHSDPEAVLVVGGGDGGALREILRHPVQKVTVVEIDPEVVEVSKEWLFSLHRGAFADPRVRVEIAPGEKFLPLCEGEFDVIIVDSTDPIGPGEALFQEEFFRSCRKALRPNGILALQAGSPWTNPTELQKVVCFLKPLFPAVVPYLGFMPLYPSGIWAYVMALEKFPAWEELERRFQERGLSTRYFTPAVFRAATVLPPFVASLLSPCPSA